MGDTCGNVQKRVATGPIHPGRFRPFSTALAVGHALVVAISLEFQGLGQHPDGLQRRKPWSELVKGGETRMILHGWGWDDQWEEQATQVNAASSQVARITGQDRGSWSLQTELGTRAARIPSSSGLDPFPVVGDWVLAEPGPESSDPWSLLGVFPRRSQISRGVPGTGRDEQILAANVDKIWIVHGLDSPPNPRRMERYLAVVWDSGASPEIVLTKTDLSEDLEHEISRLRVTAVGIPIRCVSSTDPESVQRLRDTLKPGSTVCLLGPSGVGKSTLVNVLSGEEVARIGGVREKDRRGRHTTTRRSLFQIPGGACLLDTPGIRELRIWDLGDGLRGAFPDIEGYAERCRFRDCRHETEPGCAVLAAVEDGALDPARLGSFRKLQAEAAYEQRKNDPRARAEALSERKSALKTMKYHQKYVDPS